LAHFGCPDNLILGIGIAEVACAIIYHIPHACLLGATLMTGDLGGSTAANVRVGGPLPLSIIPVALGVPVWGGFFFREERLRALIPLRSESAHMIGRVRASA
jgi:hypothetical protein